MNVCLTQQTASIVGRPSQKVIYCMSSIIYRKETSHTINGQKYTMLRRMNDEKWRNLGKCPHKTAPFSCLENNTSRVTLSRRI